MQEQREAVERIRAACAGKEPIYRFVLKETKPGQPPRRVLEVNHVSLIAGDVVAACQLAARSDDVLQALERGCADGKLERAVQLQVKDVVHLLKQVDGAV